LQYKVHAIIIGWQVFMADGADVEWWNAGTLRAAAASICIVLVAAMPAPCRADDPTTAQRVLEDTKLYFTAPLRWDGEDWAYFGGSLALIGASHAVDGRIREHFATGSNAILNGEDKNSLRDAAPTVLLIAGTAMSAAFLRDRDGYQETVSLLEAGVYSTLTAEALSYAAGRERPDATTSPNEWRQGGDSFPSVHASAAFAVGMVFAESGNDEYRWIRRIVGYGVAAATGYIRVRDNVHWLSDTVAGAALGVATARFVLNRQGAWDAQRQDSHATLQFQPAKDGWLLSYTVHTR
jgi:membrane-associated phospholipid phosphatase